MASGVRIVQKDRGLRELVKRIYDVGKPVIKVGVLDKDGGEPKTEHDGTAGDVTLADVATWMEFGTEKIPARSFIRAWFDENEERVGKMLHVMLRSVIEGKRTREQALELLGQKFAAEIQARIASGIDPPLAESTIKRKGSSTPLIDTGQLRSAISYEVEQG